MIAVAAVMAPALASVVTTDRFIVRAEDTFSEDVYVAAQSGRVEGTIEGDLVIATGSLVITGAVTGDVHVLASGRVSVESEGVVGGSLRGAARDVVVVGTVTDDVAVAALATSIDRGPGVEVGRDLVAFGGSVTLSGDVGRDVRGRMINAAISGTVGRDLDVAVERLVLKGDARIGGDVLYRSTRRAAISPVATIAGQVVRLPAQSNFVYGVVLTIANLVGFLGFLVLGIGVLWLFRNSSSTAVGAVIGHPIRTLLIGLAVVVVAPVAMLLLAVTLVGLPVAVMVLLGIVVLLLVGPVPVVTAFGDRLVRGRIGLFGGFVLGAVLWRLGIWLVPLVGGVLYLVGLVWGTGGWVYGGWLQRFAPAQPARAAPQPEPANDVLAEAGDDAGHADEEVTPPPIGGEERSPGDGGPGLQIADPEPGEESEDPEKPDEWGLPRPQ